MIGDGDVEQFVRERNRSKISSLQIFGPCAFGDDSVWEVWIYVPADEEWATRFVVAADSDLLYLDGFGAFSNHIDAKLNQLSAHAQEARVRLLMLGVAAFAFIATVCTYLYIVVTKDQAPGLVTTVLLGVVASGASFFFGRWIAVDAAHTPNA